MKRLHCLLTVVLFVVSFAVSALAAFAAEDRLPTKDNPLIVDKEEPP